jgi:hypothetical protein
MINESTLRERLHSELRDADHGLAPVPADLERGKSALRRRRIGGGVAAVALGSAAAAVFATTIGATPNGTNVRVGDDQFANGGPGVSMGGNAGSGSGTPSHREGQRVPGAEDIDRKFIDRVYAATAETLDSRGERLVKEFNMQSNGSEGDLAARGITMGWQAPGDPGLGMVRVLIVAEGSDTSMRNFATLEGYQATRPMPVPGGGTAQVSRDRSGPGFVVSYVQDDGERVEVLYDPRFGNNADTPTTAAAPRIDDVLELVASDRLNLK